MLSDLIVFTGETFVFVVDNGFVGDCCAFVDARPFNADEAGFGLGDGCFASAPWRTDVVVGVLFARTLEGSACDVCRNSRCRPRDKASKTSVCGQAPVYRMRTAFCLFNFELGVQTSNVQEEYQWWTGITVGCWPWIGIYDDTIDWLLSFMTLDGLLFVNLQDSSPRQLLVRLDVKHRDRASRRQSFGRDWSVRWMLYSPMYAEPDRRCRFSIVSHPW